MQTAEQKMHQPWLQHFCESQQLPPSYQSIAAEYFLPLADELAQNTRKQPTQPLLIGINGCQGSGKSTLALFLTEALTLLHGKTVANLSIDDFYCTKSERQSLAKTIHPLFATRGVPGTHDIQFLSEVLKQLSENNKKVAIPRFDKSIDDRAPINRWDELVAPVDIILLEGWCIGVTEQTDQALSSAINNLERDEDTDGLWRHHINRIIQTNYTELFAKIDKLIMLKAPTFNSVYDWRKKQEDKLREKTQAGDQSGIMNQEELIRFISHYQRLTEHMLSTLPATADIVFYLNNQHQIEKRVDYGDSNS